MAPRGGLRTLPLKCAHYAYSGPTRFYGAQLLGSLLAWLLYGNLAAFQLPARTRLHLPALSGSLIYCSHQVAEAIVWSVLAFPFIPDTISSRHRCPPCLQPCSGLKVLRDTRRKKRLPAPTCSQSSPPATCQEAWNVSSPTRPSLLASHSDPPSRGSRCAGTLRPRDSQLWQLGGCRLDVRKPGALRGGGVCGTSGL